VFAGKDAGAPDEAGNVDGVTVGVLDAFWASWL
jgi:hypothetical protein